MKIFHFNIMRSIINPTASEMTQQWNLLNMVGNTRHAIIHEFSELRVILFFEFHTNF